MSNYLHLPGEQGNFTSSPSIGAYTVTDLDVRMWVSVPDVTPTGSYTMICRRPAATGTWFFSISNAPANGRLRCQWYDGSFWRGSSSSVSIDTVATNNVPIWFRVTVDVNNGAGDSDQKYWYSSDGDTWTQFGTTQNTGFASSITTTSDQLNVGAYWATGISEPFVGHIYRAVFLDGIDGTAVFDADFTDLTASELAAEAFTEDSANTATVTLNGDEWAYVRPVTTGLLADAELVLQADDYNKGVSPKWADRSGNDHHAQFGSTSGSDTNDPQWLPWDGENYLRLPGVVGNNLSTPDAAALDLTDDIDIRVKVNATYSGLSRCSLLHKFSDSGYHFEVWNGTLLFFSITNSLFTLSSAHGLTNDVTYWLRVTRSWSDGDTNFYKSTNGTEWTLISNHTVSSGTHLTTNDTALTVADGGFGAFDGRLYRAQVYDGIDGTVVFDADLNDATEPFSTFTEASAQAATVTFNRSGSGLYVVDRPAFGFHTDDYFEIPDDPGLDFAADEAFTLMAVHRTSTIAVGQGVIAAKRLYLGSSPGYVLYRNSSGTYGGGGDGAVGVLDGTDFSVIAVRTAAVSTVVRNIGDDDVEAFTDAVGNGSLSDTTTATWANDKAFTIGSPTFAANRYDGEIIAVALWRSALTDQEIIQAGDELLGHLLSGDGRASSEASAILDRDVGLQGLGNASGTGFGSLEESTTMSGSGSAAAAGTADIVRIRSVSALGSAVAEATAYLNIDVLLTGGGFAASVSTALLFEASLLHRKGSTQMYDSTKETKQKDPARTTVSYQDERTSKSKMGPLSSTVEGTK